MKDHHVVFFGKPGAGKDLASNIISGKYGHYVYRCDEDLPVGCRETLKENKPLTDAQRDSFCKHQIKQVHKLKQRHTKIVMNFVFLKDKHRKMFHEAHPDVRFVMIESKKEIIQDRLRKYPRYGHVVSTEAALKIGEMFEKPTIPHTIIENNGSLGEFVASLQQPLDTHQ